MRVVFMGTPDFAVGTLKAIIEAGHDVAAVVTQPDKPRGRSKSLVFSPVKEEAVAHGITVLQPERARDEAFVEELRTYNADVIVVVAFGQLLPASIINMPRYGCINVHASLLPKYRGASPIQWAVIDGCEYSGVTTMKMDEGLDTGDILMVEKVKLDAKETGGSLFDRLSDVGALHKSFGKMDFNKSAAELERLIRGLNPWPSAFTYIDGKMLKIWDADVADNISEVQTEEVKPGQVVTVGKNTFTIACGQGYLVVNEVQLEGKKRMDSGSFLRGNQLEAGVMLGE